MGSVVPGEVVGPVGDPVPWARLDVGGEEGPSSRRGRRGGEGADELGPDEVALRLLDGSGGRARRDGRGRPPESEEDEDDQEEPEAPRRLAEDPRRRRVLRDGPGLPCRSEEDDGDDEDGPGSLARPAGGRLEVGGRGMARPGRVVPAGSGSRPRRSGTAAGGPGGDGAGAGGPRWPPGDRTERGRQEEVVDSYQLLSRSCRSRLALAGGPVAAAAGNPGLVAASLSGTVNIRRGPPVHVGWASPGGSAIALGQRPDIMPGLAEGGQIPCEGPPPPSAGPKESRGLHFDLSQKAEKR